jgi:hypothetical protein
VRILKGVITASTELKDMPDIQSATLKVFNVGEIVQIAESNGLLSWYEVEYNDTFGFINFESALLLDTKYILIENKVDVLKAPKIGSEVVFTIEYGKQFYITDATDEWIKIKEFYGNSGYIPLTTQLKLYSEFEYEENSLTPEEKGIRMGVLGGILMILISIVWFFGGYIRLQKIYFYPPFLFLIGVYALLKGIIQKNLTGN